MKTNTMKPIELTETGATDIAIKVENLSKCCQIYDNPRDRLKQFVAPRLQRLTSQSPKQYFRELVAGGLLNRPIQLSFLMEMARQNCWTWIT
jgi:hypothetical protein